MSWVGASAARIAGAVRSGEVKATHVVADHLDHARVADRVLDPLRMLRDGSAIVEAEQVDEQPDLSYLDLAGVPVVVTETTPVAGLPTANGIAHADDEVVRRLRGAGAVVVGTGRTEERATRNPWRGDRSVGGLGSAAAVAAGVAAIAHGTDAFGSVRLPAAYCGLIGFKPGNAHGWLEDSAIMATTVADAWLGFAVLTGRAPEREARHRRLRVAVSWRGPVPAPRPDADNAVALRHAARVLVGLGHDVTGDDAPHPHRLTSLKLATLAPVRTGERTDFRDRCEQWFAQRGIDVLMLPATAGSVPAAGRRATRTGWWDAGRYAYTAAWNVAGMPAMTVPMGVRRDGLPAAVQLVGPPGGEEVLLDAAAQIELGAPWRRHAPGWPRDAGRHRARVRGTIRA